MKKLSLCRSRLALIVVSLVVTAQFLFVPVAHAGFAFGPYVDLTYPGEPRSVALVDLNSDGRLDLITGNDEHFGPDDEWTSSVITVKFGNDDGTFADGTEYAVGDFWQAPVQFEVADLNQDNNLDVAVAMGGGDCVAVLPGNGDGTFDDVIKLLFTEESAPQDIVAGDFNGDGQVDLAVAVAAGAYNVSVLLHTGEATSFDYESPVNYNLGPESYSIASGDFDGDEDLDLAITTYGAKSVALLENDGSGTFAAGPSYSLTSDTWEVQSADLDADSYPDLIVAAADSIYVLIADGSGEFAAPVAYGTLENYIALTIQDFDGDGNLDIGAVSASANSHDEPSFHDFGLLPGNGDGSFGTEITFDLTASGSDWYCVGGLVSGDINGDGKPELAAVKEQNGVVAVVMNASDVSYPVDVTADPTDLGWVSRAGRYSEGETVTLTAEPDYGVRFVKWTETLPDGSVVDVSTDPIYEFTMGTAGRAFVGNFVPVCEVKVWAIPPDGGSVKGSGTYDEGTEVTVRATANTGFVFLNWTENFSEVSTDATYTFRAGDSDRTLVASFTELPHTLTVSASPEEGGTVDGGGEYASDSYVAVWATPNAGYEFVNWTEGADVVSENPTYTFFMPRNDRDLVAHFQQRFYGRVTVSADPASDGYVDGGGTHAEGSNVCVSAVPNDGHAFLYWTDGTGEVSSDSSYSFAMGTSDVDLVAHFGPLTPVWLKGTKMSVDSKISNSITVSLTKGEAAYATGYRVYVDGQLWENVETSGLTFTIKGLRPGTSYNIEVRAVHDNLESLGIAKKAKTKKK